VADAVAARPAGIRPESAQHLAESFGSTWRSVLASAGADPAATVGDSPVLAAEVRHSVLHERAETLADVVLRRTDLGTAGWPGDAVVADCAAILAELLGWDAPRVAAEIDALRAHYPRWQLRPQPARARVVPGLDLLAGSAA
jgi:glycerol-3-phosphate dehydrogenase